mmetsp:Transcript_25443/g.22606  ORF Transcript_25443/g.22606 Transcript_25443/m.22606 type:complete len:261 (+) Transcript_25443:939-1721(+)
MNHCFESDNTIYFFTEFMEGRDLKFQTINLKRGFTLNEVQMIGAQLVLGLECLHKNGYIHRDIKLENILIDKDGYVKIADFGLANTISNTERTGAAGSIEYMAPEVIDQTEYCNKPTVDWWALGILLYDLHYRETPFCNVDNIMTFGEAVIEKTKDFIKNQELQFPPDVQLGRDREYTAFRNFLKLLLAKDPTKRFGYSKRGKGASKIKKSNFFNKVDWKKLKSKKLEMPCIPYIDWKKMKKMYKKVGCDMGNMRVKKAK